MSQHFNQQHPAVGAVACPYCQSPKGVPCVTTGKLALIPLQRTETHNARVALYESPVERTRRGLPEYQKPPLGDYPTPDNTSHSS